MLLPFGGSLQVLMEKHQSLPKLLMSPQSGHVQTIPLQVIPQKFSSMQSEQIMKPQGQLQQKGCSLPHVEHTYTL
ncbi:hypothetical protein DAMNIGENAA_18490 [Desulforhabdus amnigena]|uniref:Uncharacterized protein n=1 Tax=Desulforhabdus amnigena TaxID=40218 RepID=A0A9W6FTW1_9BACT|nr:hypothetical protein DAMNIGENAA_18490 [Desulforhabdus amnigena]